MSIIQITQSGTVFSGKEEELKFLSAEFKKNTYIKLPQFLEPKLLHFIQSRIEEANFQNKSYKNLGLDSKELRLKDNTTVSILEFLLNDQNLFHLIEKITGCSKIGCFAGRIYRMSPNLDIHDAWHDDDVYNRMISISINLSKEIYSGGVLQIKEYESGKIVHEISNTGFGNAVMFIVSPDYIHRVTDVEGSFDRTAFAGWFHSKPVYKPIFKPMSTKEKTANLNNGFNISRNNILKAQKNLFYANSNNQRLVFNPKNTECYGLNDLGAKVLKMLEKPMNISEIGNEILNEYDVERDTCEKDLISLIQELESSGLIMIDNKDAPLHDDKLPKTEWEVTKCKEPV